jgi:hypothetical protein
MYLSLESEIWHQNFHFLGRWGGKTASAFWIIGNDIYTNIFGVGKVKLAIEFFIVHFVTLKALKLVVWYFPFHMDDLFSSIAAREELATVLC